MKKVKSSSEPVKKIRPALTPEARENQMISLAMDLVEQRLLNGTASSQETTHFLKLGTAKEKLERERLEKENELLEAKTKAVKSVPRMEELYKNKEIPELRRRMKNSVHYYMSKRLMATILLRLQRDGILKT